jgi:hypothetical protein
VVFKQFVGTIWHHVSRGDAMENCSYFYNAVTRIAEDRILELLQHAKMQKHGKMVFQKPARTFGHVHILSILLGATLPMDGIQMAI